MASKRCVACGSWMRAALTASCGHCHRLAGLRGGEVRREAKFYGYDVALTGRVVVDQDKPRTEEAERMVREHLAWLQSNRPASTGRRGDVAGAGAAGNSAGARASDNPTIYESGKPLHGCGWPGELHPQLDLSR
jgi:hypothetical protein